MSDLLLVGVGFMGRAYADVLRALNRPAIAIGRSADGAASFAAATGFQSFAGGVSAWLERRQPIRDAIVCVGLEETASAVIALLDAGVRRVLVEKPGGVDSREIEAVASAAKRNSARVLVAYNRRFYASAVEARRRIEAEGGVTSFHFEFTERERDATSGKFSSHAQSWWGLANSSHVIDLAFYLGGTPETLHAETAGSMPWHPAAARFAGCGRTKQGALFTYLANWESAGRWGVELMTRESRLILRPLEQLQVQRRGSFQLDAATLDDSRDRSFKPGLFDQTDAFLRGDDSSLVDIASQAARASGMFARITGEIPPAG